jgi:hypothetical protein
LVLFKGVPSEINLLIFQSIIFIFKVFSSLGTLLFKGQQRNPACPFFKLGGWAKPVVVVLRAQHQSPTLLKVQSIKLVYPFITGWIDVPVSVVYGTP